MNNDKKYIIEDGEHKNDVIVSWIITHACPENCAYCISPERCQEITKYADHLRIQNEMILNGLTKCRYIGGEPLTVKHIQYLIKDASEKGLDTRLSTNGILLTKDKLLFLKDYLNSIALPFESCNDDLNKQIRGTYNHRNIVTNRIKMIKEFDNIGVLINTCVHKENINELKELGKYLKELKIDHWKLRKFCSSSGRGAVPNKDRFEIRDDDFFEVVDMLKKENPDLRIDGRLPSKLDTRLMVSPQGDLYRMSGTSDEEIRYGNILKKKLDLKMIYERDHCN